MLIQTTENSSSKGIKTGPRHGFFFVFSSVLFTPFFFGNDGLIHLGRVLLKGAFQYVLDLLHGLTVCSECEVGYAIG